VLIDADAAEIGGMDGFVVLATGTLTAVVSGFEPVFETTRGTAGFMDGPEAEAAEVLRAMMAGAAGALPSPIDGATFDLSCGAVEVDAVVLCEMGIVGFAVETLAAAVVGLNVFLSTTAAGRTRTGGGGTAGLRGMAAFFGAAIAGTIGAFVRVPVV